MKKHVQWVARTLMVLMVAILFASPALRALAAAPDEGGKRVVRVVFLEKPRR